MIMCREISVTLLTDKCIVTLGMPCDRHQIDKLKGFGI